MYRFTEPTITFFKNVNPPGFLPLWDVDYIAKSFSEIKNIENFSDDEATSFIYYFEDMEENYESSPEDFQ